MRRFEVFYDLQIPGSVKVDGEDWVSALETFNDMGTAELMKGLDMSNPTRVENEQVPDQVGEEITDGPSLQERFHAVKAFGQGVIDSIGPQGLQVGMTWEDNADLNKLYDYGANVGEALGSLYRYLVKR